MATALTFFLCIFGYAIIQGALCLYGETRDSIKLTLKSRNKQ